MTATREVLASADAVIARVRASVGAHQDDSSDETATAIRIADEWMARAEQLALEAKLADAARRFRDQWPALIRWRERVLANAKRAKPAVVAAAYESLALECTLAGEFALAARAQQAAIDVMRRGRGTATTVSVVPIRPASNDAGEQAISA